MFCIKCGKEIEDTAKFCDGCGASIEAEAENMQKTEHAAALVNEGKNLVFRFFTKNPSDVIREAAQSKSYVGFLLIAINAILFAFISCFNVPQSVVYIFNSLVSSIQKMATSIGGSSLGGSVVGSYLPTANVSPIFDIFIPLFFAAMIMFAVEFIGIHIALKAKHQKMNHYANAVNVIGIATLPLSAVLILNFVLGFIYPLAIPFVFVATVFVHMILIYEGLRHIINDGKAPILGFSIIAAIVGIAMFIAFCIAVKQINGAIQKGISDTIGGVVSSGIDGLFGSLFGN